MAAYFMSTTVIPSGAEGIWRVTQVSLERAKTWALVHGSGLISAVGHESTAEIMSTLMGCEIPVNRVSVEPEIGDVFICFKLNSRPPEGAILDRHQLEELGYSWCVMEYLG